MLKRDYYTKVDFSVNLEIKVNRKQKDKLQTKLVFFVAEKEGFEPSLPLRTLTV